MGNERPETRCTETTEALLLQRAGYHLSETCPQLCPVCVDGQAGARTDPGERAGLPWPTTKDGAYSEGKSADLGNTAADTQ